MAALPFGASSTSWPGLGQRADQAAPQRVVIVGDQNATHGCPSCSPLTGAIPRRCSTGSVTRNRVPCRPADQIDAPVVRVHDLADDRQPEARALRLGREERVEDPSRIVRRHARAVVGDLDDDASRPGPACRRAGSWSSTPCAAAMRDRALAAERLERVDQQVGEHLAQLVWSAWISGSCSWMFIVTATAAAVHLPLGQRDRVVQHLRDRRALDLQPDRPHELEHLEDDGVGHLRFADDVVEQRLRVGRCPGCAGAAGPAITSMPASGFLTSWAIAAAISPSAASRSRSRSRSSSCSTRVRSLKNSAAPLRPPVLVADVRQRVADHLARSPSAAARRGWAGAAARTPPRACGRCRAGLPAPRCTAARCRVRAGLEVEDPVGHLVHHRQPAVARDGEHAVAHARDELPEEAVADRRRPSGPARRGLARPSRGGADARGRRVRPRRSDGPS